MQFTFFFISLHVKCYPCYIIYIAMIYMVTELDTYCIYIEFYYMTSDNVFSDRLTSLVTIFGKTLYSTRKKSREVNIIFQSSSRHLKIEMVFLNYLKSSSQSSSG